MIALGDLKSLWLNHIDDNIAAVVRDSTNINLAHLGNLAPNNYFNSGMMLININQWRNKDIQSELFKYLNENIHFRFHDQDLLNLALHERVVFIDNKWNLIPSRENAKKIFVYSLIFRLGLSKLFKLNGIIHFAASKKPWHYLSSHPFKFLWWKHLKGTQFRDFVSEDKNVFNFFFKICPKPLRFLFFK